MDVFSTFGFTMPRNSSRQAAFNLAGRKDTKGLSEKDKIAILRNLGNRPALLYMPGHIMIFLGIVDGKVYAIHSAWSWRESRMLGDTDGHGGPGRRLRHHPGQRRPRLAFETGYGHNPAWIKG